MPSLRQLADGPRRLLDGGGLRLEHEDEGASARSRASSSARAHTCAWRPGWRRPGRCRSGRCPAAASSMERLHSAGNSSSRMVCPVGAVSKITVSNAARAPGSAGRRTGGRSRKSTKRSKAATSAGAGAGHLLFHHLHDLRGERLANRAPSRGRCTPAWPGPGRSPSPTGRCALDGRDLVADGLLEHIRQVGGRVGGHDQGAAPLIGQPHRGGAGHGGFADAALARKEEKTGCSLQRSFQGLRRSPGGWDTRPS